jgi:hypothetical protein
MPTYSVAFFKFEVASTARDLANESGKKVMLGHMII